jgi:SOS response regulatory protein OraA/RecX
VQTLQRKGKGTFYIKKYLIQKGLPLVKIDSEIELENARKVFSRRFGPSRPLLLEKKQKAFRFLKSRGYLDSIIRKLLNSDED